MNFAQHVVLCYHLLQVVRTGRETTEKLLTQTDCTNKPIQVQLNRTGFMAAVRISGFEF